MKRIHLSYFVGKVITLHHTKQALRVGDEEVVFALLDSMKYSLDYDDSCFYVDVTDSIIDDIMHEMGHNKPVKESLDETQEEETPHCFTTVKLRHKCLKKMEDSHLNVERQDQAFA